MAFFECVPSQDLSLSLFVPGLPLLTATKREQIVKENIFAHIRSD